jgi:hypothetical protein
MKTGTTERGSETESDQATTDDEDVEIGFGEVLFRNGHLSLCMLKK